MPRKTRKWNKAFLKYMDFIIKHPNYADMPFLYKKDGSIRWVASAKSTIGRARMAWWDKKRKELGIKKEGPWISKVARKIHPTGEKPCQICGKMMKLDYVYPNKRGTLSPGAMSNAPDRLDGYHSYNLCCRSKQDTGRSKENLNRYGEDRRVYENWSDGDWKAASWLMKVFNKYGLSPDHTGPISLGFCHRPYFKPTTRPLNSAKNNRMTYADVLLLIKDEKRGKKVISEHSKYIWSSLKGHIKNDRDALLLSKIMRMNLHNVLTIFFKIYKEGHKDFLVKHFLHPEYANYSIKFIGFDAQTGEYQQMIKVPGNKKQYENNSARYIRKSLNALEKYGKVSNRNTKILRDKEIKRSEERLFKNLSERKYSRALIKLNKIFKEMAVFYSQYFFQNQ